jgi:lysophospholipase L1-like esterase
VIAINLVVLASLYVAAEIVLHIWSPGRNPLNFKDPFNVAHPVFHHGYRPRFDGYGYWRLRRIREITNSLGFRDGSMREVPMITDRKRVVFFGDSDTVGLGLNYEETFVARFAAAHPELDVLNAAVEAFAPSADYSELKYFVEHGLKFEEAIVYLDISDIQSEAAKYRFDEHGRLQRYDDDCPNPPPVAWKEWLKGIFYIPSAIYRAIHFRRQMESLEEASDGELTAPGAVYARDYWRAAWTYDAAAACYGTMGVEGGIRKAEEEMDRFYEFARAHGIAVSVAVYPWPQQLLYDVEESRQVRIWRDWCQDKCKAFYDHFPAFFRYKQSHQDFLSELYIRGDIHFTAKGAALLADDLLAKYR